MSKIDRENTLMRALLERRQLIEKCEQEIVTLKGELKELLKLPPEEKTANGQGEAT